VRKAAVAGVIVVVGLGVTAAWAVARGEHPRPSLVAPTTTAAPATPDTPPSAADGLRLTVSDVEVAPGDTVTVSGEGCGAGLVSEAPPGSDAARWSVQIWLSPAAGTVDWQPSFGEPVATLGPDADGAWSAELVVPEWRAEYRLEAACLDGASPPGGFVYRHERIVAT
jgi:hypothetical protein